MCFSPSYQMKYTISTVYDGSSGGMSTSAYELTYSSASNSFYMADKANNMIYKFTSSFSKSDYVSVNGATFVRYAGQEGGNDVLYFASTDFNSINKYNTSTTSWPTSTNVTALAALDTSSKFSMQSY